jgi:hypothetical protein
MYRSALAALLLLAAPAPVLAAHSLTAPPNGTSGCAAIAAAGNGVMEDPADLLTTPVGDELDVTLTAAATKGLSFPELYIGSMSYVCTLLGAGTVGYGAAHGVLSIETSSTPDFLLPTPVNEPNIFGNDGRAVGQGLLSLQFDDTGEVVSNTLPDGTPVTLEFVFSLDASAILIPGPAGPLIGASASYAVKATDVEGAGEVTRLLVGNEIVTVELDTAVGNHIDLQGRLDLGANALAGRVQAGEQYVAQRDASIDASHTATFAIDPPDGVGFDAESGHEYAVPEPGAALALVSGALTLAAARRRRRSRNTAAGAAHVLQGIAAGT